MTRSASRDTPTLLAVDARSPLALHQQLYAELRSAILSGRFAPGTPLPASRTLAKDLGISRNTVLSAVDQLHAEGYLEPRHGSGTFVTRSLPDEMLWTPNARNTPSTPRAAGRLSARGKRLSRGGTFFPPVRAVPFRHGLPALDAFPRRLWARIAARHWRKLTTHDLGYGDAAGYAPLRKAIAEYLGQARAVRCQAEQVLVIAGSQQALYLTAQMLLDPGDDVWLEDPGYLGARAAFHAAQANIVPVPVDEQGLSVAAAKKRSVAARVAYVTPSNQYPTTVTMSPARRLELLDWARRSHMWIIEDDYDSEFRFTSRPISSLQGLDAAGRVIYIGTFSKLLAPGLRLGYIVLPPLLVDSFVAASAVFTRHLPSVEQIVLAEFIAEGHLARHVRRMREIYLERRACLVSEIQRELADCLEIQAPDAGTHALAWLRNGLEDGRAAQLAAQHGVESRPFSIYSMRAARRSGLVLGYGAFGKMEIRAGVKRLGTALRSSKQPR